MNGVEFVQEYASKGQPAWEAAALAIARNGELTPWPFVPLTLTDGTNTAILQVQSDVLSIGPVGEHLRLPLTPGGAQNILNLYGWLLPTPWLVYKIWQQARQMDPTPLPNKGGSLKQYAEHSNIIDQQLKNAGALPGKLVAGIKKHVVVSNIAQPGKVLIFGWYHPSPPFPDVYNDKKPWDTAFTEKQPVQANSNFHGDFYADYSHGIQAIGPTAIVNGQVMNTVDLYQHLTLSKLVSNEGPIRVTRYPSSVAPAKNRPSSLAIFPAAQFAPNLPSRADYGLDQLSKVSGTRPEGRVSSLYSFQRNAMRHRVPV